MHPVAEHPRTDEEEVDEVRWVTPDEAAEVLTYDADRVLVATAVTAPGAPS